MSVTFRSKLSAILERVERFENKLYLEFGGKFSSIIMPHGFCPATTPT